MERVPTKNARRGRNKRRHGRFGQIRVGAPEFSHEQDAEIPPRINARRRILWNA